jgi:hypothetical protein
LYVAKNAEIQSAVDRVEAAERDKHDVDDATIALSEEELAEVDEHYEPVRSRSFTFEVPADKLKDGEGKVRVCCKTRYNECVICDLSRWIPLGYTSPPRNHPQARVYSAACLPSLRVCAPS